MGTERHPSGIDQRIVRKMVGRRGRLHLYEDLHPARTALVVLDLDAGSVQRDPRILRTVDPVNDVAHRLREGGGTVAWVTTPSPTISEHSRAILGTAADAYLADWVDGGPGHHLWPELDAVRTDVRATKRGSSAFFPGKADLHEQLVQRGVDTILVAGAVTNVCCESSARDAAELDYRVVMISDALTGHSFGAHEASLAAIYRNFGDVRPSSEIIDLLGR